MTQPATRTQKHHISRVIKRQLWVLFILIALAIVIDMVLLHTQLLVAKSLSIGALLSFATQVVFASFIFWHSGYRARQHIVTQLYRGQMVKWLLTIVGFAAIFIMVKPLSAPALFFGFIIMQISHSLLLWKQH